MTIYNKKTENESENLKQFINSLIDEYDKKLKLIHDEKKSFMNELSENEAVICSLEKAKKNNSNLFSPNSKEFNIDEYITENEKLKSKLEENSKSEIELENIILNLRKIRDDIFNQNHPNLDMGLNILEIQEQDRQRIARDLHDSTVQNLTSLIHKCELCARLIDTDPIRTRLELLTMSNTLKSVINEIREIIFNLKPMSIDDLGLIVTIERFANQLMMQHEVKIKITHNEEKDKIVPVINLSLFRMIQEACNNAIKHGDAKNIEIGIQYNDNYIDISIKDDGKGFDTNCMKEHVPPDYTGCGLTMMKERVYLLSGTMKINSTINKGTVINISVPIK